MTPLLICAVLAGLIFLVSVLRMGGYGYAPPTWKANGTIEVCSLCTIDTTGDHLVIQSTTAGGILCGVAQEGLATPPGVAGTNNTIAAVAGGQISIKVAGCVCLVWCNAAITRGAELVSDSGGLAVAVTNNGGSPVLQFVIGLLLESASAAGVTPQMFVMPYWKYF